MGRQLEGRNYFILQSSQFRKWSMGLIVKAVGVDVSVAGSSQSQRKHDKDT
jgi:hypothetical protein